jgi:hypothetical protein
VSRRLTTACSETLSGEEFNSAVLKKKFLNAGGRRIGVVKGDGTGNFEGLTHTESQISILFFSCHFDRLRTPNFANVEGYANFDHSIF